jgi:hypothetical protein
MTSAGSVDSERPGADAGEAGIGGALEIAAAGLEPATRGL